MKPNTLSTDNLHHAQAVVGGSEYIKTLVSDFLVGILGENFLAHPDVWWGTFDIFTVDDARALRERQSMKPVQGKRKYLIVETSRFTVEAQNALLKVLEEPTAGTHIFLLIPELSGLLPTVVSRLQIFQDKAERASVFSQAELERFVEYTPAECLQSDFIVAMIKDKNRALARNFLIDLEYYIYKQGRQMAELSLAQRQALAHLVQMQDYILDTSSSVKLILERVCLLLQSL